MVHWRIVGSLCFALLCFGAYSLWAMPRQEFPEFTIRQGLVVGVMPGADSRQVDEQLTRVVENYLFGFDEVNKSKTYSYSRDGQMVIYVELKESVNGLEAPAFWAKLRHGLTELKMQLPSQVVALIGTNDFGDTSALLLSLTAEGKSWGDVDLYMRDLEAELRRLPATSKVKRVGEQTESIRIHVSRDRLSQYGIRPASVLQALQGTGNPARGGSSGRSGHRTAHPCLSGSAQREGTRRDRTPFRGRQHGAPEGRGASGARL